MKIEKLGAGALYPEVQGIGTKVVLIAYDSVLEFDCAVLQGKSPVHIDVMQGADGKMVEGFCNGNKYVANIDIPAAKFDSLPGNEEGTVEIVKLPFTNADLATVKVTLWEINPKNETTMSE